MTRKVPITIHIHHIVEVWDDFTDEELMSSYNDGTSCINDDLDDIVDLLSNPPYQCQCQNSYITLGHDDWEEPEEDDPPKPMKLMDVLANLDPLGLGDLPPSQAECRVCGSRDHDHNHEYEPPPVHEPETSGSERLTPPPIFDETDVHYE